MVSVVLFTQPSPVMVNVGVEPVMDAVIEFETFNAAEFAPKKAAFELKFWTTSVNDKALL